KLKDQLDIHYDYYIINKEYNKLRIINVADYDETIKNDLHKIHTAKQAAEAMLTVSSATNGRVSQRAFEMQEEVTGVELKEISADRAAERFTFQSITTQPREVIPTPVFSGSNKLGRR